MSKEYTLDFHVKRLEKMLNRENTCDCCPARQNLNPNRVPLQMAVLNSLWGVNHIDHEVCNMCRNFIDLDATGGCPCIILGKEEALKRTDKALARYYRRSK